MRPRNEGGTRKEAITGEERNKMRIQGTRNRPYRELAKPKGWLIFSDDFFQGLGELLNNSVLLLSLTKESFTTCVKMIDARVKLVVFLEVPYTLHPSHESVQLYDLERVE